MIPGKLHSYEHKNRGLNRRWFQFGFFLLFIFSPILDIFRFDLNETHFILFGHVWTLGIDSLINGSASPEQAVLNLFLRGFLPLISIVFVLAWVSWKYGRLYCGWLCPHFSVVESINNIMHNASGKFSLWDKNKYSSRYQDNHSSVKRRIGWLFVCFSVLTFSFLWATVLLTYLLPAREIYANLWHAQLSANQARFIAVGTLLFSIEFMFFRHLFCRFGCAIGVFQSLFWMANRKAMVVSFDRQRAHACRDCGSDNRKACDDICPMRLKPRTIKRSMFSCTQCSQCLLACEKVQQPHHRSPILRWQSGQDALQESDR